MHSINANKRSEQGIEVIYGTTEGIEPIIFLNNTFEKLRGHHKL